MYTGFFWSTIKQIIPKNVSCILSSNKDSKPRHIIKGINVDVQKMDLFNDGGIYE